MLYLRKSKVIGNGLHSARSTGIWRYAAFNSAAFTAGYRQQSWFP